MDHYLFMSRRNQLLTTTSYNCV